MDDGQPNPGYGELKPSPIPSRPADVHAVSPAEAVLLEATTIERILDPAACERLERVPWTSGRTQVAQGCPLPNAAGPVAAIDSRGQRAIADDAVR
jgi:hypothetical protein